MKYENFETISKIVSKIKYHQKNLDDISCYPTVQVYSEMNSQLYDIGIEGTCGHEYTELAKQLVGAIKDDLQQRIDNLKSQLEIL